MQDTGHLDSIEVRQARAVLAKSENTIANLTKTAAKLAAIVDVLPLDTDTAESEARALLSTLETLDREADKVRTEEKEPHLRAGQAVDAKFKGPRAELQRVAKRLRDRIGERAVARERAAAAARQEAVEAAQRKDSEAVNTALARVMEVSAPVTQNGVAESFTWDVESITLGEVPAEFLMVDLTKVKAYVKDCDKAGIEPKIAGVRFKRAATLRVSSVR
jgi:hypothetical protein